MGGLAAAGYDVNKATRHLLSSRSDFLDPATFNPNDPTSDWAWTDANHSYSGGQVGYDLNNHITWEGLPSLLTKGHDTVSILDGWKTVVAPIPASKFGTGNYPVNASAISILKKKVMATTPAATPISIAGAPAWFNTGLNSILTGQQSLDTSVTSLNQTAQAGTAAAQSTNAAVTQAAATGGANSANTQTYLIIGGLAALAYFMLKK